MQRESAMLGLIVHPEAGLPIYQQLFDQIAERIRDGALPAGYRLPPTRGLAGRLGTHRNTVVRAYAKLEEAGFVTCTVGRGTFVRAAVELITPSAPEAPAPTELPWSTMLSDAVRSEPMQRFGRFARRAGTGSFINLTRMQPPPELLPHELLRRCLDHVLRTYGARALAYSAPREGVTRLRDAIATDLSRLGVPALAEQILVTTGSQQALDLISRALVNPGDTVLTASSTYRGALTTFAAAGARIVGVACDQEGPIVEELARLGSQRPKLLYLMPNHSNPTGACISEARRRAILAWSQEAQVALIEDDYAADLVLDAIAAPTPLRAMSSQVIHVGTFSKRLIPALRIGYVVMPPALRDPLIALKHTADLGNSSLTQLALAEFLDRGYLRAHINRIQPAYRDRRDALVAALSKSLPDDVHWERPRRGVTLWLRLPNGVDSERAFEECLRRGVLVTPGSLNVADGGSSDGLRLNFCFEPEGRLAESAPRIAEAINAARRSADGDPAPIEIV